MKRALLVGINQYPGAPLQGCVNDIEDMGNFLVNKMGFDPADIRLVADARATTAAIKDRLGWLMTNARDDDQLVFHYSGHGAQMPLRNNQGEVDRVHDVICPVDFDWSEEHAIADVDFKRMFASLPDAIEFIWISDSCHSGDLTRAIPRRNCRPKVLIPPADIAWRMKAAKSDRIVPLGFQKALMEAKGADTPFQGAFISGCRSDQTSADASFVGPDGKDRPNGALTYYLLSQLGMKDGLTTPVKGLVPQIVAALASAGYDQEPQLHGSPIVTGKPFLGGAPTPGR